MLKYWELEIDGTDRVGKDTLTSYIALLTNYRFSINSRGLMSQLVYNRKYKRNVIYDLTTFNKNKIIIWLYAEEEDLKIRCDLTNEKSYSIIEDTNLFKTTYDFLKNNNFKIFAYNTSKHTPYSIAKDIIKKIEEMEK